MHAFLISAQRQNPCWQPWWRPAYLAIVGILCILAGDAAMAESTPPVSCSTIAARVVSVEGTLERRQSGESHWQKVEADSLLCQGDWVSVRAHSRATLRFSNNSMLRLDQKTTFIITAPAKVESTTLLELIEGKLHIFTRTPKPFKIKAPFINASVEGTEFVVDAQPHQSSVVVYEGKVNAENAQGSILLRDNEAAIAGKDDAPRKTETIHPLDAVQWALYYPTIIDYRLDEQTLPESLRLIWQQAFDHYHQGQLPAALQQLDQIDPSAWTADLLVLRAGWLLSAGRVAEARENIEAALRLESDNGNTYALQAIIAVVQNDKETALALANQAVAHRPDSPTARLALSYAQQAHFQIEAALASVETAITLDNQLALAWARLAELRMALSDLDRALDAAQQAVKLDPHLGKTQTVLGFAHLLRIDMQQAKAAFNRAISLDQADPMPRLGMGLALVREGKLEAGRIEIETAVSLDPANSLLRSYLGKAYFEEKRYGLASTQFDLARQRDPFDPTPWLYDAIQKQTQNRPVEALRDIQKSIELNDNRAVYRSKLLLDQDQAARGSSLARIYDNLGFEKRALMETARSLSFDPSSHSAHRFLSDAYTNIPRHEISRVSELLQAQLLQPINVNPVQPHLAVADLNIITGTGPSAMGFNEFSPLMERNKLQLVTSGIFGSNSTLGNEVVASALFNRASISVGQFHYDTKGFRENNDQKHNLYNAFMQYAVTPKFNVQAELRTRKSENGDLLLDFDPHPEKSKRDDSYNRTIKEDLVRLGAHYAISPQQDLLVSGKLIDRSEQIDFTFLKSGKPGRTDLDNAGFQVEAQHLFKNQYFNSITGGGAYEFDWKETSNTNINKIERQNFYNYTGVNWKNINATLGLSYDTFTNSLDDKRDDKINPKFGLQWNITDYLRLRAAWFEATKSHLLAQQSIEPTQVAGFNQFFDDTNGTRSKRSGIGLDTKILTNVFGGVEASERKLHVPFHVENKEVLQPQKERLYRTYLYWSPHSYWTIKGELQYEVFLRNSDKKLKVLKELDPIKIQTLIAPIGLDFFHPSGFYSKFIATYVSQDLTRNIDMSDQRSRDPRTTNSGVDSFFLIDALIGFRLPNRRGMISLEGRNLLNTDFFYRSINFQQSETAGPRFMPERTLFLRLTLNI